MTVQADQEGVEESRRSFFTLPPSFALLAVLALAFVLPGLFNHGPWKSFDAIGVEVIHQMQVTGNWLVPSVAGDPWLEDPPLFHWMALLFAKLFSFAMPFHDAARIASGIAVLAACAFVYAARRKQAGEEGPRPSEAATPVLLLIGTIGLMVHAHEAITDLSTLAACSAALAAMIRALERPLVFGGGFGLALGIAFLSTGVVAPIALLAAAVVTILACAEVRNRKGALFLAAGAVVAIVVACSWPLALRAQAPAMYSTWLAQALQQHGRFGANLSYFFGISAWFLWPLWPLALWTLWARRKFLLTLELFVPIVAFSLLFLGIALVGPRQDINLLVAVPPLVLFSAHGLPALRRGAAAAFDWFGVMTFGFFAFLIWGGYIAMMTGWPPKIANNFAKLAPGFVAQFQWLPFMTAVALTALWVALIVQLPPAPSRSATRWAAGIVVFWGTFATLWMPWADHIKTYRTVAVELKSKIRDAGACIAGRNFGTPQRAALSYHAGLRIRGPEFESRCDFLVVQGTPKHERDAPGPGWRKVADVGRAGDKAERFRLYRKEP